MPRPYDGLTPQEKMFVDEVIQDAFDRQPASLPFRLRGDDTCEAAVDGLATWVIASRPS